MWRVNGCFTLFMVMSLSVDMSIGCVNHFFQDVLFFLFLFLSTIVFGLFVMGFSLFVASGK